ncbi:MAG: FAD-dependent oxidoreductase [Cyanobacteria bacterium P01_A01_bin.84]
MKSYDIIVIGAGIAGAAIAYELIQKGVSVLLLEKNPNPDSATIHSYGGLAFWSGTTELTRQLCNEGRSRYENLLTELDNDIEYRELDLLLTISTENEPKKIAKSYQSFAIPPKLLSIKEACELEPQLNKEGISGALTVKHGHINPIKLTQAYIQTFLRLGGDIKFASVLELKTISENSQSIIVNTDRGIYESANAIVCAGGFSRQLLKASSIQTQIYFTHAQIIKTPPVGLKLHTLVMPANLQRFQLESESTSSDEAWDELGNQLGWILDPGAVQFLDGSLRLGQISSVFTNPLSKVDSSESESALRQGIEKILPTVGKLPGSVCSCLVAFSKDGLPLIGSIPGKDNIHLFSGFSNPLVIIPPLAKRFANYLIGNQDNIIPLSCPQRFEN